MLRVFKIIDRTVEGFNGTIGGMNPAPQPFGGSLARKDRVRKCQGMGLAPQPLAAVTAKFLTK